MARILIVDDDFEILAMFGEMLEGAGYEVVDARNGKVALEITKEDPDVYCSVGNPNVRLE